MAGRHSGGGSAVAWGTCVALLLAMILTILAGSSAQVRAAQQEEADSRARVQAQEVLDAAAAARLPWTDPRWHAGQRLDAGGLAPCAAPAPGCVQIISVGANGPLSVLHVHLVALTAGHLPCPVTLRVVAATTGEPPALDQIGVDARPTRRP